MQMESTSKQVQDRQSEGQKLFISLVVEKPLKSTEALNDAQDAHIKAIDGWIEQGERLKLKIERLPVDASDFTDLVSAQMAG